MTLKLKDPCCRAFFIRNEDLLPFCFQIYVWGPKDKIDMTPSQIFPWDFGVKSPVSFPAPKFATGLLANLGERGFKCIHFEFFGVN